MYRFTTKDLDELKLLSPATHYASTSKIQLDDFKLCPKAHRDNGHLVSSATFLMFQYNKYMADLLSRRKRERQGTATDGSGGLSLTLDDPVYEGVLAAAAAASNNTTNNALPSNSGRFQPTF